MAINTLTGWTNKFLQKLNTLTTQDKIDARTLIDAASHTDTVAALATKQALSSVLTTFAAGTPATAIGDSTAQANRRGMIGAASTVSPNFTSPTCVTPADGDNSSLIANTAFVQTAVNAATVCLSGASPLFTTLDITGGTALPDTVISWPALTLDPNPHPDLAAELAWVDSASLGSSTPEYSVIRSSGNNWTISLALFGALFDGGSLATDDPSLVTWVPIDGYATGELVVSSNSTTGGYIGQLYRAGASAPYTWYVWNGTTWDDITTP